MKTQTPMIKDMTDEGLVEHYIGLKSLIYNAAAMRKTRNMTTMLRHLNITVAIARKRGLALPV